MSDGNSLPHHCQTIAADIRSRAEVQLRKCCRRLPHKLLEMLELLELLLGMLLLKMVIMVMVIAVVLVLLFAMVFIL